MFLTICFLFLSNFAPRAIAAPDQAGQSDVATSTTRQRANARTFFYQGQNSFQLKRYDEALLFFQQAAKLDPELAEAHFSIGAVFYAQFKYKSASESFAEAIRLRPNWMPAYFLKAEVDIGRSQSQQAKETALKAIQAQPNSAEAHYWLGKSIGSSQEALQHYEQAIRLNPRYAPAHSQKGLVYNLQGRDQEAVASYQRAIELDPQYVEAHDYLGRLYIKLKKYSLARVEIQILTELKDPNARHIEKQLQRAEKLAAAEEAIKLRPNDPKAIFNLGMAVMDDDPWRGDEHLLRARDLFQKAIRMGPKYVESHWGLGLCYIALRDMKAAQQEYAILQRLNKKLAAKLSQKIQSGPDIMPRFTSPDR